MNAKSTNLLRHIRSVTTPILLLLLLPLGIGGLLAHRAVPSVLIAESPVRSASKSQAIEIKGRVLDPDGKPFSGARLYLMPYASRKKAVVRAKSDKGGRFRFTAKPADFNEIGKATLAVTADGFGPDWIEVTSKNKDPLTLRLVNDDVPIEGRVLDLEGKPVAKVTVRVLELYRGLDYYTKSIAAAELDAPMQAIAGKDGRFQLHGLGRERLAHLVIEGDTIERIQCWALTRESKILTPPKGLSKRDEPIYPAAFDHIAAPTKPIVGMVRDKATGKPLSGITVLMERSINSAVTDERGRFRITGNAKQREYNVNAVGKPYFVVRKQHIADTPGLQPLVVNFELERGIEITGRVFNKDTGEPIQADITYRALTDNPYLKKVSGLDYGEGNFIDDRTHGKADGTFFVIGLPGPGYLTALAAQDDYHKPEWPADGKNVVPSINTVPQLVHAWVRINPSEKDPKSIYCDIALEPAKPIPGQVQDADGKPLGGFFVAGLTGSPRILSNEMNLHEKSTFQVRGFDAGRPRTLLFLHPKKKLGTIVLVREHKRDPLQVRLQPLGAVAGRVLDADGQPRAGLQVRAETICEDVKLRNTLQLFEWGLRHNKFDLLTNTDAGGKFRLDGLLPGLNYTLMVSEGDLKAGARVVVRRAITGIASGKTKDMGDLKSN